MKHDSKNIKVAILYSHDSEEHINNVNRFCATLRDVWGFEAVIDTIKRQETSAINFRKMQHQFFTAFNKIIVVLSRGYKLKAEGFSGGVGEEYQILINDLPSNPQKYVFVMLNSSNLNDIVPVGLRGYDVLDLELTSNWTLLNAKLQETTVSIFPPVNDSMRPVQTKTIQTDVIKQKLTCKVFKLIGRKSTIANKIYRINLDLKVVISNESDTNLEKVLLQFNSLEDFFDFDDFTKKPSSKIDLELFKGQEEVISLPSLQIHSGNCYKFLSQDFKISLFSKLEKVDLFLNFSEIPWEDNFEANYLNVSDF
ncbi:SEFIR domain-containing protein [Lacihabitans soyangensis]|uniref:SEFIR domain-containing protein n=1 Tax=Lacihabitans soyangensis TaxID=869394 RepID=A0AAE3H0Y5_9BACT|nr:SEFIR domain-containing protein [Lacihabitans soyangensis]MCP9762979.1 hypothetical protein [Lacihabitans soyangensis]